MKKTLTLIASLAMAAAVHADDFSLYCEATDGATTELAAVADMRKIVFFDGKMHIEKKDGTTSITQVSFLSKIYFSTPEAVGIGSVTADGGTNAALTDGDTDATSAGATGTALHGIHDMMGRKLNVQSISELPKGIYIVNGKKTAIR